MEAPQSEARQRVLTEAERLFSERGYAAVTLRDIANAVGIRHASIYHHVPGGKEALFVEVTERNLERHRQGIQQRLAATAPNVTAQLRAIAHWLLDQPPMDLIRMMHSDMPGIDQNSARHLMWLAYDALLEPITGVLRKAEARGEIHHENLPLIAGGFLGMIENLHAVPSHVIETSLEQMADDLIDVMLNGITAPQPELSHE